MEERHVCFLQKNPPHCGPSPRSWVSADNELLSPCARGSPCPPAAACLPLVQCAVCCPLGLAVRREGVERPETWPINPICLQSWQHFWGHPMSLGLILHKNVSTVLRDVKTLPSLSEDHGLGSQVSQCPCYLCLLLFPSPFSD